MSIHELLSTGSENGVGLRSLANMAQLSEREVRLSIQRERLNGIPICSNNKDGYYLPASEWEKNRCVKSLRHRAREILKVASALEKSGVST